MAAIKLISETVINAAREISKLIATILELILGRIDCINYCYYNMRPKIKISIYIIRITKISNVLAAVKKRFEATLYYSKGFGEEKDMVRSVRV